MSSLSDVCLLRFLVTFRSSNGLTFVVAKKILVRSNTASSTQTKCTALVVIDEDTDNEDIRRLFSHLSRILI
jgi:hypothetical protein